MSLLLRFPLFLVGLLLCPLLFAAGFDFDFEEKVWSEMEVQLPAFPAKSDLVAFKVGAARDKLFQIDSRSLSVGSDDVIRYTMVVTSSEGAQSVSYEGMRCLTGERRLYAFGHADSTWSKARSNQWTRITGSLNNHHVELFVNYFCNSSAPSIRSAEDALRSLRNGGYRWK